MMIGFFSCMVVIAFPLIRFGERDNWRLLPCAELFDCFDDESGIRWAKGAESLDELDDFAIVDESLGEVGERMR